MRKTSDLIPSRLPPALDDFDDADRTPLGGTEDRALSSSTARPVRGGTIVGYELDHRLPARLPARGMPVGSPCSIVPDGWIGTPADWSRRYLVRAIGVSVATLALTRDEDEDESEDEEDAACSSLALSLLAAWDREACEGAEHVSGAMRVP